MFLKAHDSPPVLAAAARTTPTDVPLRTSSDTVKKYWACSNTGDATELPTTLMFTLALTGAVRPPPSSADITIEMTVLALPWSEREREITPVEGDRWREKGEYTEHTVVVIMYIYFYWVHFGAGWDTCVFVEREVSGASSRNRSVGHPAICSRVRVICCYFYNRGSWGTMGAEADCVQDWIEDWSVVIDVHHRHPHTGHRAQTTLQKIKNKFVF